MIYRTLHSYILRELLRIFLLTATALTMLLAFGGTFKPLTKQGIDVSQLMVILIYLMPAMLAYAIPIAALFAAVLVYWRMSTDNELTACRAGGVSFVSIVMPAFVLGLAVASADLVFVNYVVPHFLQSTERVVMSDLGSLIVSQITHQDKFEWPGKLVVTADNAELTPADKDHPNAIVKLQGMAASWLDQGKPTLTVIAQDATLTIRNLPQEESVEIDFALRNFTTFDPNNAFSRVQGSFELGAVNSFMPDGRPLRVPSLLKDKPKFLNLRDLMGLYKDPYLFPEVAGWVNRIESATSYQAVALKVKDWFDQTRKTTGKDAVTFQQISAGGKDKDTVTLNAASAEIDPAEAPERCLTFKGKPGNPVIIEQRVNGQLVNIYTSPAVKMVLNRDSLSPGGITTTLEMQGKNVTRENRAQGIKPEQTDNTTLEGIILEPRLREVPELTGDNNHAAERELYFQARKSPQQTLSRLAANAADAISKLDHTITSELHSRGSFSLSCLMLVMLGAALGILLRGKNPLAVFVVGFVPAVLLVLLITAGREVTEGKGDHLTAGISLIWAGNAVLLLLVAGIYTKLLRR